jgi:hypothetical protein
MRRVGSPSVWRLVWALHRAPMVQMQLVKLPWLALKGRMEGSLWLALKMKMEGSLLLARDGNYPQW